MSGVDRRAVRSSAGEETPTASVQWEATLARLRDDTSWTVQEALAAFRGLVEGCHGDDRVDGMDLVRLAMDRPQWRDEAIAACPALFRRGVEKHRRWANAFHVLAERGDADDPIPDTPEQVRSTLEALEDIGVPHTEGPGGNTPLFTACTGRHRNVILGFVMHEPSPGLNVKRKSKGLTPLLWLIEHERDDHHALQLIDLGADPLLPGADGRLPLEAAVACRRWSLAHRLLATDCHRPEHLDRVASDGLDAQFMAHLQACRGRHAVRAVTSGAGLEVRPL